MKRLALQVRSWADAGVDLIQLREKHLEGGALLQLAEAALCALHETPSHAKLLINTRADLAIAARAHGVHLTAHPDELSPQQVRALFAHAELPTPIVSVSCHTLDDITRARDNRADLILFGPVFEKRNGGELISAGIGLETLRRACELAQPASVLALGGISNENAAACLAAGTAGVAGIRLFE
jgi:thiamine-phosphate pyrophosphorylase